MTLQFSQELNLLNHLFRFMVLIYLIVLNILSNEFRFFIESNSNLNMDCLALSFYIYQQPIHHYFMITNQVRLNFHQHKIIHLLIFEELQEVQRIMMIQISNDKTIAISKKSSKDFSKAFNLLSVLLKQLNFHQLKREQMSSFVYNSDNLTWYN